MGGDGNAETIGASALLWSHCTLVSCDVTVGGSHTARSSLSSPTAGIPHGAYSIARAAEHRTPPAQRTLKHRCKSWHPSAHGPQRSVGCSTTRGQQDSPPQCMANCPLQPETSPHGIAFRLPPKQHRASYMAWHPAPPYQEEPAP